MPVSPSPAGGGGGGGRGSGGHGGGSGPPPAGGPGARVARRRPRWRRVALVTGLVVLLVAGLAMIAAWFYARGLDDNMGRTDAFSQITAERPAKADPSATNILMLGSDSRDPDAADGPYRADTIMLMHVPPDQDGAYLISIPRDLWVPVPNADGSQGGNAKINSATATGGVPLMVQTVESYTGVRLDHVMMIDFGGFVEVTDALGGVEMNIEQTITSIHGGNRVFEEGRQHLNGEEALDYIRQRKQFADGDFTRMRNQQQFLEALMDKAASSGTLTNPGRLNAFLQTATSTLTVDEDLSLRDMAWKFRHLRSDNLTFLTTPHAGTGSAGGQSVVFSDDNAAADLYQAVQDGRLAQWVADNPDRVR